MSGRDKRRPPWVEDPDSPAFTTSVLPAASASQRPHRPARPRAASPAELATGILAADRRALAQAITLVESNAVHHGAAAQELLQLLLPAAGKAIRVGITGVPGVGKSTLIEALGLRLCEAGKQLAVLAVDPSSKRSRGSILGDKTRMEQLSRHRGAFIRPSPTGGTLGGVTRKTRETITLCEAFGCDVVLVETVGVGQSETTVRQLVDFFLLLVLPGGGDELQGLKKGVVELADAVVVNKADGENLGLAQATAADYRRALRYLAAASRDWKSPTLSCSAHSGEGIAKLWQTVEEFFARQELSGALQQRRRAQLVAWTRELVERELVERFYRNQRIKAQLRGLEESVLAGTITATNAALELLALFDGLES